jgi:uncharacterized protein (DUF1330 family)
VAAYVIAENLGTRNPEAMAAYRLKVAETVAQYGGKFLLRHGVVHELEGDWRPAFVVIEFPSVDQARAWYDSPEYRPLREDRWRYADTRLALIAGV